MLMIVSFFSGRNNDPVPARKTTLSFLFGSSAETRFPTTFVFSCAITKKCIIKTHPQAKIRVMERRKKNLKSNTTIGAAVCTLTIGAAARNPNYQGSRKQP